MPVSPRDFALWASATGNKYPQTAAEKMAAAPHAYDFVRNFGKTGANAPGPRVGGQIVFDQPVSVQFADNNSVFQSPVTPDNNIPKVAGTLDNTMTGEHYDNQVRDTQEDNARGNNLIRNLGQAALATGAIAGTAILATNPAARQAVRSAATTAQQQALNIGSRILSFLSGDVTPPTTGQRYQQERIPTAVQTMQAAKGANVGTPEKSIVPTTTAATGVKPVTESEKIATQQSFSPSETGYRSSALADYEKAMPPSEAMQEARRQAATAQLQSAVKTIRSQEPYQPDLPGINTALMVLRNKEVGVSPEEAGIYQPPAPSKLGPTTTQYSLFQTTPESSSSGYTPTKEAYSEQTADLKPTVADRVQKFITVLDLGKGESVQIPESQIGRGIETPKGLISSMVPEPVSVASTIELEPPGVLAGPRQRVIPESHAKAYDIVAAGAQRGHAIPFDRALEIVTNPETPLSFGEQQAFEKHTPIALAGQSFEPGARTTGQMRSVRTGEESGQRAEELLDRYARENVSGLTPTGRQSASSSQMRGLPTEASEQQERLFEKQINPSGVLTTPTGRAMRNISALDPEALAEGREEYAPHTFATTGANPEAAAKAHASATSSERVRQMNSLFGPENSATLLHLRTENGIKTISPRELKGQIRDTANAVFDRAAVYHANQQGVDLPDKNQDYLGYLQTANAVLYKNPDVANVAIGQMARAFDQDLRAKHGLKMEASNNPDTRKASQALHTFMNVARGTTVGQLALEHFNTLAGRARSQERVRTSTSMIPVGIPGPSQSQVRQIMGQAGLGQPSLNPPSIGY